MQRPADSYKSPCRGLQNVFQMTIWWNHHQDQHWFPYCPATVLFFLMLSRDFWTIFFFLIGKKCFIIPIRFFLAKVFDVWAYKNLLFIELGIWSTATEFLFVGNSIKFFLWCFRFLFRFGNFKLSIPLGYFCSFFIWIDMLSDRKPWLI